VATLATEAAFSERLRALEDLAAYIQQRLRAPLSVARANPGSSPPTFAILTADEAEPVLSFGLIDTIFFWTFDGGTSCHYSRDRELMFRIIATELARSQFISPAPAR
jgi:hypothetical protein